MKALVPVAGLTALRLLRCAGSVAGRRILLTGASGGVGHYVTELAASSGADITVVTATAERGQRLAALGAAAVVHDIGVSAGPFDRNVGIFTVRDGKIAAVREYTDTQHAAHVLFGQS